jgi:hypothetical protein
MAAKPGQRQPQAVGCTHRHPLEGERPFGGLKPWPHSSSNASQAPQVRRRPLLPDRSAPATRRSAPHPTRPPAGLGPARPSPAAAATDPTRPRCGPPEPLAHHRGDAVQRPGQISPPHAAGPRPNQRGQADPLSEADLAAPAPNSSRPAPAGHGRPALAATGSPASGSPDRMATSRSLAPSSIHYAASRTSSRRASSSARETRHLWPGSLIAS